MARSGLGSAAAAGENCANSSPFHHHNGCSASALDYEVLCDKLENNDLAGAILDGFNPEPIDKNSRLWNIKNLIITPHVSSDDNGNYVKLTLELFVKNLKLFIKKKELTNQIDKELGY